MSDGPQLHRPIPRRPFDLLADDAAVSPTTPGGGGSSSNDYLDPYGSDRDSGFPPKRSRSTVSLTASTLFGIYGKTYTDEAGTPSQLTRNNSIADLASSLKPFTPLAAREEADAALRRRPPKSAATSATSLLFRIASLFAFGVAYGVIVTHLHERAAPLLASKRYLVCWGLAGVGLGNVLPWLDGKDASSSSSSNLASSHRRDWDWTPAVRSIGAFVGIAYAIRRLPWQSTLQVSLALALVNPFLWFLVDRTRSGFWFASLVGIAGTAFLLQISPEMIQAPHQHSHSQQMGGGGLVSVEGIAVGTWIASVLFCSCVCFGNIGRRLAPKQAI